MLKAVIFDFDGVITDSEILHFRAFNSVLARYGVELTTQEYYSRYLGFNDVDCFKLLISEGRLKVQPGDVAGLVKAKAAVFEDLARNEGRLIGGVRGFLRMLTQARVPMAICSGALLPEIEMTLEEVGLRDAFEVIVSAEHVRKGKPDPEGMLLTLRRLSSKLNQRIDAGQCVVIEDSNWGLQAARAAGMHTVAVTNSYSAEQLSSAEKVVANLDELSIEDLRRLCG